MRQSLVAMLVLAAFLVGCSEEIPAATPDTPQTSGRPSTDAGTPNVSATPDEARTAKSSVSPPPTRARTGTVVKTAGSEFGRILFDGTGQAIYLFDKETTSRPACYGPCADAWPPVLTTGAPRPSGATGSKLLGTTKRTDGSTQVTYAGHPLYFYAHEGKNEVLCHNVTEFGGLWLVVTPGGEPAP